MGRAVDSQDAHTKEFRLPDLGEGLTGAEIVRWLVQVGDVVAVNQVVVEVETAKAVVEVPTPYEGVVTACFGEEGTELPVGAPLLRVAVGQPEDGPAHGERGSRGAADARAPEVSTSSDQRRGGRPSTAGEGSGNVLVGYGTTGAPARRRRLRPPAAGTTATAGNERPSAGTPGGVGASQGGGLRAADRRSSGGGTARRRQAGAATGGGTRGTPGRPSTPGASGGPGRGGPVRDDRAGGGRVGAGGAGGGRAGSDRIGGDRSGGDRVAGGRSPARSGVRGGAVPAAGPVPVISPLVRKLARDHGLDLRELVGTGPAGLIMRGDVEHAIWGVADTRGARHATAPQVGGESRRAVDMGAGRGASGGPAADAAEGAWWTGRAERAPGVRVPLRGVRGVIADKMTQSRREIPEASCWVDVDATELLHARTAMNRAAGPKISVLALFARICTAALVRYPELNATVDTEAREIVQFEAVHLGFAAQTERGLMVPVVRDADARDAESLSTECARLTEAARAGTLTPGELTGGTFTLNNYGVFGVDGSTPIINHPEAAMLGIGRIAAKPWVHEGELAVRHVVQLSLTFDHRVCDGGTAGGFLRYVADCVQQPAVLLRTL